MKYIIIFLSKIFVNKKSKFQNIIIKKNYLLRIIQKIYFSIIKNINFERKNKNFVYKFDFT